MNILCVDDDAMIVKGLSTIIQRFALPNTQIFGATSGVHALEMLKHNAFDVVISDIDMPLMSGLEMIHEARRLGYCENFIVLTGYDKFEYTREAIRNHVCDYMLKPINRQELCENLRTLQAKIEDAHPVAHVDERLNAVGLGCFDASRDDLPAKMRQLLEYIDTHYPLDISLEMLGERLKLHPNYICTLFREHLSTSFLRYLDIVRLKKSAQILLNDPGATIRDVAAASGFLSDSHFYKVCKKRLGCTPANLRKQLTISK